MLVELKGVDALYPLYGRMDIEGGAALQDLIAATRSGQWFVEGLSPRAGIAVLRAAKARALLAQRDYVAPDDIQAILPQAIAHRLVPVARSGRGRLEQVRAMLDAVPLP